MIMVQVAYFQWHTRSKRKMPWMKPGLLRDSGSISSVAEMDKFPAKQGWRVKVMG
jgi:hypothetical protein